MEDGARLLPSHRTMGRTHHPPSSLSKLQTLINNKNLPYVKLIAP